MPEDFGGWMRLTELDKEIISRYVSRSEHKESFWGLPRARMTYRARSLGFMLPPGFFTEGMCISALMWNRKEYKTGFWGGNAAGLLFYSRGLGIKINPSKEDLTEFDKGLEMIRRSSEEHPGRALAELHYFRQGLGLPSKMTDEDGGKILAAASRSHWLEPSVPHYTDMLRLVKALGIPKTITKADEALIKKHLQETRRTLADDLKGPNKENHWLYSLMLAMQYNLNELYPREKKQLDMPPLKKFA